MTRQQARIIKVKVAAGALPFLYIKKNLTKYVNFLVTLIYENNRSSQQAKKDGYYHCSG